jgi:uncharacterized protein (DUF952 family)
MGAALPSGYIIHVATPADWACGADTPHYQAGHFAAEGFHHACTPAQVAGVLGRHFSGHRLLLLLVVDTARLASPLRWEPAHGQDYPHVYGPIERAAVTDVIPIEGDSFGEFVLPEWASSPQP